MIELRLTPADLSLVRFAYSPLAEVAESLCMLAKGRREPVHEPWLREARERMRGLDTELLGAVVPPRPVLASFLFVGAQSPLTTIECQLAVLSTSDPDWIRTELEGVWAGGPMPDAAVRLVKDGRAGVRRIADAMHAYWQATMEPHWPRMRAAFDADLTHRVARLTAGGLNAVLADLHPQVSADGLTIGVATGRHSATHDLAGRGLLLIPSVFAWPRLMVAVGPPNTPAISYGLRGVRTVWEQAPARTDGDALGALLGRTRATILARLDLPLTTTRLAELTGLSAPTVSQHLSILRRCGLVTSRRAGRNVLYCRTGLATSLVGMATELC